MVQIPEAHSELHSPAHHPRHPSRGPWGHSDSPRELSTSHNIYGSVVSLDTRPPGERGSPCQGQPSGTAAHTARPSTCSRRHRHRHRHRRRCRRSPKASESSEQRIRPKENLNSAPNNSNYFSHHIQPHHQNQNHQHQHLIHTSVSASHQAKGIPIITHLLLEPERDF